jgi:hypothetical protein
VWRHSLLAALVAATAALGLASTASAQSSVSGPTVMLDRYELSPGEQVDLTMDGFEADFVTMAFCGNEGRRGSVDCNMQASQAREINSDGSPTVARMTVAAPPSPCPCIVRVSSQDNREIAVVSITIVGHPIADVDGGSAADQPLAVDIRAVVAPGGLSDELRSSLGGATMYDVTVQVTNSGTFAVENVAVASTYTRTRYDDVRTVDIPSAGRLDAGATWEQTVQVEVPSLTFGDVEWNATVSGFGPSVQATDTTSQLPVLLVLLGVILVADVFVLVVRFLMRRRRRNLDDDEPSGTAPDGGGGSAIEDELLVGSSSVRNDPVQEFAS